MTFYNAIANNGKIVRPRFVKGVMKDGVMVKEFPVEVIKEKICGDKALKDMQMILEKVVSEGTGKKAGTKHFLVSGKTGTAQVSKGAGGYRGGNMQYLVSFCGYFPSDAPKYSCIVAMRKPNYPASGGTHAGPVFSTIAERVYSKNLATDLALAKDSTSCPTPDVKTGDYQAANVVLNELGVSSSSSSSQTWQRASHNGSSVSFTPINQNDNLVPDVTGMGARDAIYAMESKGLKVKVHGIGKVKKQSVAPGHEIQAGTTVTLEMD